MQFNLRTFINQALNSVHTPLSQQFINDPCMALEENSSDMNFIGRFLGELARLDTLFDEVYPSFRSVARRFDCSTKTLSRGTKKLVGLGILIVKRRFNNSYKYLLNPEIKTIEMMRKLSPKVEFFRKMVWDLFFMPGSVMAQKFLAKMPLGRIKSAYLPPVDVYTNQNNTLDTTKIFPNTPPGGDYISVHGPPEPFEVRSVPKKEEFGVEKPKLRENPMNLPRVSRLTDDAKVGLMAYPQEVIENALQSMEKISGIRNRLKWLQSRCFNICKEKGIHPSWGIANQMKSQVPIKENPEIYKPSISHKDIPRVCDVRPSQAPKINRTHESAESLRSLDMWGITEHLDNLISMAKQKEGKI